MVDFVSDTNLVRRLARNVLVADFTDPQIVNEQKFAYSKIGISTGKYDWAAPDPRFPHVQKLEEELAVMYILMHYGSGTPEELNWIAFYKDDVKEGLTQLVDESTDTEADLNILIALSKDESYPSALRDDSNAQPYRSTDVIV